jgi:hypothetical protein
METNSNKTNLALEAKRARLAQALLRKTSQAKKYPLSFAQRRLWLLDQLEEGAHHYNMATGVRLRGTLDVSALERALQEVVGRHEILRTTFRLVSDEP